VILAAAVEQAALRHDRWLRAWLVTNDEFDRSMLEEARMVHRTLERELCASTAVGGW
jgi:hypothetical protein